MAVPASARPVRFVGIDATRIAPQLYQGSRPPPGPALRRAGFGMLVLCAVEHQPPADQFPGVTVVRARIDDSGRPMEQREWLEALRASNVAAHAVRAGRAVLTTCAMGLNRSGLVNALTLCRLTRMGGRDAAALIRRRRAHALSNRYFVAALATVPRRR
jgi:hypothetical protein